MERLPAGLRRRRLINATGTPWAPWTVVPADSKTHRNLMIAREHQAHARRPEAALPAERPGPRQDQGGLTSKTPHGDDDHDRFVRRVPGAGRLPPEAQGALRHRGEPVRRPRRRDQHHAAHPAGHGCGGHPPRPQPLGRRGGDRGAAGRRAGHRDQQLPGRPRRVLQVHDRPAARAWRRAHPGVRRRRRRDRAERDRRAAGPRRGAHLQPGRRPAHGPAGDDRRDGDAVRRGPVAACTEGARRDPRPGRTGTACARAADHRARERPGRRR